MAKAKSPHLKKDRQDDKNAVANIRTGVRIGEDFLSTTDKKGGYSAAFNALKKVGAITGQPDKSATQDDKRAEIQAGVNAARTKGMQKYGLRNL